MENSQQALNARLERRRLTRSFGKKKWYGFDWELSPEGQPYGTRVVDGETELVTLNDIPADMKKYFLDTLLPQWENKWETKRQRMRFGKANDAYVEWVRTQQAKALVNLRAIRWNNIVNRTNYGDDTLDNPPTDDEEGGFEWDEIRRPNAAMFQQARNQIGMLQNPYELWFEKVRRQEEQQLDVIEIE